MILTPLKNEELLDLFDPTSLRVLDFCMKKTLIAQPERLINQAPLPIQVPKEHIEQWVAQAIGAVPVGAGSYPVDLIKENEFGADIKMLSCKINASGQLSDTTSGETSLAQKFTSAGVNLDIAFANKEYDKIVQDWSNILELKLSRVKVEQNINKIYYIFILRAASKFYLCATKVDLDLINTMSADKDNSTSTSVFVNNLIDDNFGNAKIYKSKKRLELRLKPKYWVENNYVITFDFNNYVSPMINLRDLVQNQNLIEYMNRFIGDVFNE
ncbi:MULTISPECIES: hypothetical protein [unclassified Clostridioides]|uniref:hypothetical protein n=1 Tax=unclassified Clostridioides TaxID=2635829 RepID=UPI001D128946|nr:hypothetical protein [Clostridioides sp. ES-W-0018-02]MCC0705295.1 hypothetical protein [Clostridioides sp. ES-S-0049-02]MCC0713397.1 hypothetical protein [Clostridioides sp. ES-W-0017-02]